MTINKFYWCGAGGLAYTLYVYKRCLQMKEVGKISQNVCGTDVCEHFPYKERVFHPISLYVQKNATSGRG